MTGELTLRGRVLAVGGIREKVLAAHRAGLKIILIPERNKKDLIEVAKNVLSEIEIIGVKLMNEVIQQALLPAESLPKDKPKARPRRKIESVPKEEKTIRRAPKPRQSGIRPPIQSAREQPMTGQTAAED
jgi:ATP-dependent Lon protease